VTILLAYLAAVVAAALAVLVVIIASAVIVSRATKAGPGSGGAWAMMLAFGMPFLLTPVAGNFVGVTAALLWPGLGWAGAAAIAIAVTYLVCLLFVQGYRGLGSFDLGLKGHAMLLGYGLFDALILSGLLRSLPLLSRA
jgi:hypothetical protein